MAPKRPLLAGVIGIAGLLALPVVSTKVSAVGSVTVSPTSLSFPATFIGATSEIDVTVKNVSGAPVMPNYSGGAPADPANFGGSQNCAGVTLPAGGTCTFTYEFTPTKAGSISSSTTIGIDADDFNITMQGTGLFPISLSQTTLNFPDTPVGSTSTIDIVVRNDSPVGHTPNYAGGAPLDPANFGGSQNCAGITLPAGGTCTFTYEFTPTAIGPLTSSTSIGIDSKDFSISLSGTGTDPTATTTTTSTSSTTTTTSPTSSTTTSVGPTTVAPSTTAPTGSVVLVPSPLSAGGNAHVVAQGIVTFPDGVFGWDLQHLDAADLVQPFTFGSPAPPMFLAATDVAPLLLTVDGRSAALLDDGEAAFVLGGTSRVLATAATPAPATGVGAVRITFVSATRAPSFSPGAGNRDVNLVAATIEPGEGLHVVAPFPVVVYVIDGTVHDAPENTEVPAGTSRVFNDADLSNQDSVPARVLIAAIGSTVP